MLGLSSATLWKTRRGPTRSSASNQPPTAITARYVFQVHGDVAGFPEVVVIDVIDLIVPVAFFLMKKFFGVRKRAHLEVVLVTIGGAVVEARAAGRRWADGGARREVGVEAEVGGEHEGAVVIGVVTHKEVGDWSLRRGGFEGGVRVDHSGGGEEAIVGDAPDAGFAVVVGDVVEEPLDGVVGVGAFVEIFRDFFVFGGVTSTNVPSDR